MKWIGYATAGAIVFFVILYGITQVLSVPAGREYQASLERLEKLGAPMSFDEFADARKGRVSPPESPESLESRPSASRDTAAVERDLVAELEKSAADFEQSLDRSFDLRRIIDAYLHSVRSDKVNENGRPRRGPMEIAAEEGPRIDTKWITPRFLALVEELASPAATASRYLAPDDEIRGIRQRKEQYARTRTNHRNGPGADIARKFEDDLVITDLGGSLLMLDALCRWHEGDCSAFLNLLREWVLIEAYRTQENHPFILVTTWVCTLPAQMFFTPDCSESARRDLIAALEEKCSRDRVLDAVEYRMILCRDFFESPRKYADVMNSDFGQTLTTWAIRAYSWNAASFWREHDAAKCMDLLARQLEASRLPYWQAKDQLAALWREQGELGWTTPHTMFRSPIAIIMNLGQADSEARFAIWKTSLDLYRFKQDRGEYPESLRDLVPLYAAAVPVDPFCGESLHYSTCKEGYILFSVGENGVADLKQIPEYAPGEPSFGDFVCGMPVELKDDIVANVENRVPGAAMVRDNLESLPRAKPGE